MILGERTLARHIIAQAVRDVGYAGPDRADAVRFCTAARGQWAQAREYWCDAADMCPDAFRERMLAEVAKPPKSKNKPSRQTNIWTPERADLVRRLYPTDTHTVEIARQANLLPGRMVNAQAVYDFARRMGWRSGVGQPVRPTSKMPPIGLPSAAAHQAAEVRA